MTDPDDDDEPTVLPDGYDDSEPGTIPELFARPLPGDGVRGDVLLPHRKADAATPGQPEPPAE